MSLRPPPAGKAYRLEVAYLIRDIVFATSERIAQIRSGGQDEHPKQILFDDVDYGGYYIVNLEDDND